jgi:hypothetical protein
MIRVGMGLRAYGKGWLKCKERMEGSRRDRMDEEGGKRCEVGVRWGSRWD